MTLLTLLFLSWAAAEEPEDPFAEYDVGGEPPASLVEQIHTSPVYRIDILEDSARDAKSEYAKDLIPELTKEAGRFPHPTIYAVEARLDTDKNK
ncbi:MAG: hypothetical protein HN348_27090, partial [Proteobacteria bacterium]|nr:hypothetical protein [Pseudomonadota bacterium]